MVKLDHHLQSCTKKKIYCDAILEYKRTGENSLGEREVRV